MSDQVLATDTLATPANSLLDPLASAWQQADELGIELIPTPLDKQPSAYIQTSWSDKTWGLINQVFVKAVQASDSLAVHLRWRCDTPVRNIHDINVYADACALMFPASSGNAAVSSLNPDLPQSMGSESSPVNLWYWRAGAVAPLIGEAKGIGTVTRESDANGLQASGLWQAEEWQVVLMGPMPGLMGGDTLPVAFAVWAGSHAERAGIKSFTPTFCDLRLSTPAGDAG
ncbi:MAG: ethylbenzene dehydrogenase-related protein [Gammaproteobacteria bacterium]|nr:ethylbenzene dehydrogenase-related protein [Gammaproteobacteria bacterium]